MPKILSNFRIRQVSVYLVLWSFFFFLMSFCFVFFFSYIYIFHIFHIFFCFISHLFLIKDHFGLFKWFYNNSFTIRITYWKRSVFRISRCHNLYNIDRKPIYRTLVKTITNRGQSCRNQQWILKLINSLTANVR